MTDGKELVQRIDSFLQALSAPNDLSEDDQRRAALVLACSPLRKCIFDYFNFEIGLLRRNVDEWYKSKKMSEPDAWKCWLEEKRALSNENTFEKSVSKAWRDKLAEYEKKLLNENEFAEPDDKELVREVVRSFPIVNKEMYDLFMREFARCDENGTVQERIEEMWKLGDGKTNKPVPDQSDRKPKWGLIDDNVNVRCRVCDAVFRKPGKDDNHNKWPDYVYFPGARVRQVKRGNQSNEPLVGVITRVEPEDPTQSPFSVKYTVKWDERDEEKQYSGKQLQLQPCDCGDDHHEDCDWKHVHEVKSPQNECNHGSCKFNSRIVSWGVDNEDDIRFQLYQLFGPKDYITSKDKWIPTPPANETALLHIVAGLTPDPLIRRVADAVRMRTRNHWGHDTVREFEYPCYIGLMVTFVELMCSAMSVDASTYRKTLEDLKEDIASVKISKEIVDELRESLTMLKDFLLYEELSVKVVELGEKIVEMDEKIVEVDERVEALESNKVNRRTTLPVCLTTTPMLPRDGHVAHVCELIQQSSAPVAIVGDAGIGKTTLANMVGKAMVDQFDNDVHFLVVGQSPDIERCQRRLYKSLGGDADHEEIKEKGEVELRRDLEALLNDRKALIILDDVWDLSDAVSLGCRNCSSARFLITSRHRGIVDEISVKFELGLLTNDEAKKLLLDQTRKKNWVDEPCDWLLDQTGLDWVDEPCDWLLEFCGGLILAVCIVGSMVCKKSKSKGQYSGKGAWTWVMNELKNKSIGGLESSVEERLDVALKKSIESLGDFKDRFYDLGIFHENTVIKKVMLKHWWTSLDVEQCLESFDDMSLIKPLDDGLLAFQLHDLVCKFLKDTIIADESLPERVWGFVNVLSPTPLVLPQHEDLIQPSDLDISSQVLKLHSPLLLESDVFMSRLVKSLNITRVQEGRGFLIVRVLARELASNETVIERLLTVIHDAILGRVVLPILARMGPRLSPKMNQVVVERLFQLLIMEIFDDMDVLNVVGCMNLSDEHREQYRKCMMSVVERGGCSDFRLLDNANGEILPFIVNMLIKWLGDVDRRSRAVNICFHGCQALSDDLCLRILPSLLSVLGESDVDSQVKSDAIHVASRLRMRDCDFSVAIDSLRGMIDQSTTDGWLALALTLMDPVSVDVTMLRVLLECIKDRVDGKLVMSIVDYGEYLVPIVARMGMVSEYVDMLLDQARNQPYVLRLLVRLSHYGDVKRIIESLMEIIRTTNKQYLIRSVYSSLYSLKSSLEYGEIVVAVLKRITRGDEIMFDVSGITEMIQLIPEDLTDDFIRHVDITCRKVAVKFELAERDNYTMEEIDAIKTMHMGDFVDQYDVFEQFSRHAKLNLALLQCVIAATWKDKATPERIETTVRQALQVGFGFEEGNPDMDQPLLLKSLKDIGPVDGVPDDVIDLLLERLDDNDPLTRHHAIASLNALSSLATNRCQEIVEALKKKVWDRDEDVRWEAEHVLAEHGLIMDKETCKVT